MSWSLESGKAGSGEGVRPTRTTGREQRKTEEAVGCESDYL